MNWYKINGKWVLGRYYTEVKNSKSLLRGNIPSTTGFFWNRALSPSEIQELYDGLKFEEIN